MGIRAAPIVPDAILDALIDVIFAPPPIKLVAVVVPDTFTFCRKVAFVFVRILSVTAIPVSADPLNDTPPIVLALSSMVALPALPVVS